MCDSRARLLSLWRDYVVFRKALAVSLLSFFSFSHASQRIPSRFDSRENFQNSFHVDTNVAPCKCSIHRFDRERESKPILFLRRRARSKEIREAGGLEGVGTGENPRVRRAEFIIKKPKRRQCLPFHLPFGSQCINIQAAMRLFVSRQCQVVYFIFHNTPAIHPASSPPARL